MTTGPRRADRIEVRGLRIVATHGALAEERDRAQPFELDLDLVLAEGAGGSDRLADTVDYGTVLERTSEVVRSSSFALLEALAGAVAEGILTLDDRIERVRVAVRKLRPPVPHDVDTVGVSVHRGRPTPGGG